MFHGYIKIWSSHTHTHTHTRKVATAQTSLWSIQYIIMQNTVMLEKMSVAGIFLAE